ncbi:MAG: YraN family protein, partial [bacterium]|nr:YraN family protein [bacterium]
WAAKHLRRKRYKVIARNLRTAVGEVDLLCLAPDRRTIVIVEVKTRTAARGGQAPRVAPELALNRAKQRKLITVAQDLARRKKWVGRAVRIDLVAIDVGADGRPAIRHHENAVTL